MLILEHDMAWNHCTKLMFELHFLFQISIFMFLKTLLHFYIYPRVMGGKHVDYEFYNLFIQIQPMILNHINVMLIQISLI